jgi:hypothetical protein
MREINTTSMFAGPRVVGLTEWNHSLMDAFYGTNNKHRLKLLNYKSSNSTTKILEPIYPAISSINA